MCVQTGCITKRYNRPPLALPHSPESGGGGSHHGGEWAPGRVEGPPVVEGSAKAGVPRKARFGASGGRQDSSPPGGVSGGAIIVPPRENDREGPPRGGATRPPAALAAHGGANRRFAGWGGSRTEGTSGVVRRLSSPRSPTSPPEGHKCPPRETMNRGSLNGVQARRGNKLGRSPAAHVPRGSSPPSQGVLNPVATHGPHQLDCLGRAPGIAA